MTLQQSPSIDIQVLGPVRVSSGDGGATGPLLTQPRRLAVLLYLTLARPRGMHSRDTLIALLWPEADESRGRHALRNALHAIRQALGDNLILTEGDALVGINSRRVRCDALELEDAISAGPSLEALRHFEGELLQGFHVSEAPEFERWLDAERKRLQDIVVAAGASLVDRYRNAGDPAGALEAARRTAVLAPHDEPAQRRLLQVLLESGDRSGALRAYEAFAIRLKEEFGAEPSPETQELLRSWKGTAKAAPEARQQHAPGPPAGPESPDTGRSFLSRHRIPLIAAAVVLVTLVTLAARSQKPAAPVRQSEEQASEAAVNRALSAFALSIPLKYQADTAVFQRYLRLESYIAVRDGQAARDSFQQMVQQEPLYAPAWAGYGMALSLSAFYDIPPASALPRSVAAAERALALDSTLAEPHYVLIANAMFGDWDLSSARARLDAALARWPNDAELTNLLAAWHRWKGELDQAVTVKRQALALDPLSPFYRNQVAWNLYLSHRCAEAADIHRHMASEYPEAPSAHLALYRALKCLGRTTEAHEALRMSLYEQGDSALGKLLDAPLTPARIEAARLAIFHQRIGFFQKWRTDGYFAPVSLAMQYAELKIADTTLMWLDTMYVERDMMLHTVPFDPLYDFLRPDPRFQAFLDRLPWHPSIPASPNAR